MKSTPNEIMDTTLAAIESGFAIIMIPGTGAAGGPDIELAMIDPALVPSLRLYLRSVMRQNNVTELTREENKHEVN